jgi:alkylation response protein AidB-like acyl-CoA dehydrogenase
VTAPPSPLDRARSLATDVLFARALDVDRGRSSPVAGLDALAGAGLYGLHAPTRAGGSAADADTAGRVVEALAGGCLTTTFVWIQHQGVVKRLVRAEGAVAEQWLPGLATGAHRAGVAVGGIRPGRDPLVAVRDGDHWVLSGTIPWVSGLGMVDVLLVAAREDEHGDVVWLLADAPALADGPDLTSADPAVSLRRVDLAAVDAATSAVVDLAGLRVPADRAVRRQPLAEWQAADAAGLRTNGSLALGVATRCALLADADWLHAEVDTVRARLDAASPAALPGARADAARLVWRAAETLLVTTGGRGLVLGSHAQRVAREAMFLQVFGSRPAIRDAHLAHLGAGR